MSDRGSDYYTTKGQGSQEVYDAYYDEYGDSTVWQSVNVDTQGNIAVTRHGGERDFVTTAESIKRALGEDETNVLMIVLGLIVAYNIL